KGSVQLPAQLAPLQLVELGDVGFCAEDSVTVRFSSGGRSLDVPASSAAPLVFMAPLWLDPVTGRPTGGEVSVTLVGPRESAPVASALRLEELVTEPYARSLGEYSLAFMQGSLAALSEARSALAGGIGGARAQDAELEQAQHMIELLGAAVREVQQTGGTAARLPLVDGRELTLDRESVAVLDALSRSYLEQATALLSESVSKSGPSGQLRQAQVRLLTDNWFSALMEQMNRGQLEMAGLFATHAGSLLTVGAYALGAPAAPYIAGLSALTFAVTTIVPAATALVINVGTRLSYGDLRGNLWQAIRDPFKHIVDSSLSGVASETISDFISPTTELGAAAVSVLDDQTQASSSLIERATDWLFGTGADGAAAGAPLPGDEADGFDPVAPGPVFPVPQPTPDETPDQMAEDEPEEEEETEEEPVPPAPNVNCSEGACFTAEFISRRYCANFDTGEAWYEIGNRRVQCGDFRDAADVIDCDERADEACVGL
ncbi:MAG TPA: hypothetical protein VJU61_13290, partial [Polyangiaceae bacterium]|nr:hypothetical protein [Polyangiaceae bacterium]